MEQNLKPEMLLYDGIEADEEKVWLIVAKYNALVEIERITGLMSLCGFIPIDTEVFNPFRYRCLLKFENKLFLFPHYEKDICVYYIEERKFGYIQLDHERIKGNGAWKFSGCEKVDNKAVVFGFSSLVLILDLCTFTLEYLDLNDTLQESLKIEYWFLRYGYIKDKKIFLTPLSYAYIVEIDIFSRNVEYYKLPEKGDVWIDNPVFVESKLYYFQRKEGKEVVLKSFDLKSGKLERYDLGIKRLNDVKVFGFAAYFNDTLWLLPGSCEFGFQFDLKRRKLDTINGLPVVPVSRLKNEFPYEFNYRNGIQTKNNHIIAVHAWSCQMVDIDMASGYIKTVQIKKKESREWAKVYEELLDHFSGHDIKTEWMEGIFEAYIRKQNKFEESGNDSSMVNVGHIIYQIIKNKD